MGGVQLVLRTEASQIDDAMELMTLMLDRPMIDPDAFAEWSREPMIRWGDKDPLDLALAQLFCEALISQDQGLTINDAQRVLARMVHSAQIEIGIAGAISAPDVIERGGELFGSLSRREPERSGACDQRGVNAGGECALPVSGDREGVVVGMRGEGLADLDRLRAIVVASLVLDERLDAAVERLGLEAVSMRADVVTSEALGDRWAIIMRSRGGSQEQAEQVFDDVLRDLDRAGISEDEIEEAKDRLISMIERVFDSPRYWSVRMSMLGQQGRGVESIWSIREGYRGVSAAEASEALRAALRSPDRFRIEFQPAGR
jgi:predicted Zn-dependent peptidase